MNETSRGKRGKLARRRGEWGGVVAKKARLSSLSLSLFLLEPIEAGEVKKSFFAPKVFSEMQFFDFLVKGMLLERRDDDDWSLLGQLAAHSMIDHRPATEWPIVCFSLSSFHTSGRKREMPKGILHFFGNIQNLLEKFPSKF